MSSEKICQLLTHRIGEPKAQRRVPAEYFSTFASSLPPTLEHYWKTHGFASHSNGLLSFVDPYDFDGVLNLWLQGTPLESIDDFHVFAIGAFGTICAWSERQNQTIEIDCIYGRCDASAKDFNISKKADLSMGSFLLTIKKDTFDTYGGAEGDELLFDSAFKRLGALAYNEIYGFEPALALGGEPRAENIRKVRADVHLALLHEFGGPLTFPYW